MLVYTATNIFHSLSLRIRIGSMNNASNSMGRYTSVLSEDIVDSSNPYPYSKQFTSYLTSLNSTHFDANYLLGVVHDDCFIFLCFLPWNKNEYSKLFDKMVDELVILVSTND